MGYTFLATVTFNSTQDNRFLDSFSLKWMDGVDFACGCVSVCSDKEIMPTNGIMHHILLMVNAV